MQLDWTLALIGGAIIGVAVTIMLLFNGRVTGISGIINGIFNLQTGDVLWRFAFVLGLFVGGFILRAFYPHAFDGAINLSTTNTAIAGLLVGFGTIMGSGCTSGHGVCGLSRLSLRSLISTVTFIGAGIIAVVVLRKLGVIV